MPHHLLEQGVPCHTANYFQKEANAARVCWPVDFATASIVAQSFILIVAVWIYSRSRQLCRRYVLETFHYNMLGQIPIKNLDPAKFFWWQCIQSLWRLEFLTVLIR
jgi:hypothetical protein